MWPRRGPGERRLAPLEARPAQQVREEEAWIRWACVWALKDAKEGELGVVQTLPCQQARAHI